jgi:peptide/nickel transport system permease protein
MTGSQVASISPAPAAGVFPETPSDRFRRRALTHRGFIIGASIVVFVLLVALAAQWIAPFDPYDQDLARRLIDPVWYPDGSWVHPLGTDKFGRDYLSRLIYGARISLLIGFVTMLFSGTIGTVMGLTAGYFGGRVDAFVMYLVTVRLSLPVVLVALAVVSLIGSSLFIVTTVLGFLLWDRFAVVVRTVTQRCTAQEYILAARAIGASNWSIILKEIVPNVANAIIVVGTLEMANAILLESALSFLGLGVQPPLPSWGLMISEAREFVFFSSWLITLPGGALFVLILAINLLGDGLRDITAPEVRSR